MSHYHQTIFDTSLPQNNVPSNPIFLPCSSPEFLDDLLRIPIIRCQQAKKEDHTNYLINFIYLNPESWNAWTYTVIIIATAWCRSTWSKATPLGILSAYWISAWPILALLNSTKIECTMIGPQLSLYFRLVSRTRHRGTDINRRMGKQCSTLTQSMWILLLNKTTLCT